MPIGVTLTSHERILLLATLTHTVSLLRQTRNDGFGGDPSLNTIGCGSQSPDVCRQTVSHNWRALQGHDVIIELLLFI